MRGKVEKAMLGLGNKWREKDFKGLGEGNNRLKTIMTETSRCIKCYSCINACPICYCVECSARKPYLVPPGQVPPPFMFHMIRFVHISDSCVNCGQCEELCPMDIRNSLFMHAIPDRPREDVRARRRESICPFRCSPSSRSRPSGPGLLPRGATEIYDIFKK